jgi:hypothetical protein
MVEKIATAFVFCNFVRTYYRKDKPDVGEIDGKALIIRNGDNTTEITLEIDEDVTLEI